MTYWNSEGMSQCRSALEDSAKRIRKLADQYTEEYNSAKGGAGDKRFLAELSESLFTIAGMEVSIAEGIAVIDGLYAKNEQKIADYFDLIVQRVPNTVLGTSTMYNLREQEEHMPFVRNKRD